MSEEILWALLQLLSVIAKQKEGISSEEKEHIESFLKQRLNESSVKEYLLIFDSYLKNDDENAVPVNKINVLSRFPFLKRSDETEIYKRISKELSSKQKVKVILSLLELINYNKTIKPKRIEVVDSAAKIFGIDREELDSIKQFVFNESVDKTDFPELLIISSEYKSGLYNKFIKAENFDGLVIILRIPSVDMYFMKYVGTDTLFLNDLKVTPGQIYLLTNSGEIGFPRQKKIYYSEITLNFLGDFSRTKILFEARDVYYKFANGQVGLRDINISEISGNMIGIMGVSGAGKTTLLNLLAGLEQPSYGDILINNLNVYENKNKFKRIIGYIPQDDLLIENLTVFENLYYNAKLLFRDLTEKQLKEKVFVTISNLGLSHISDVKVGSPLNKNISGGQRKRLNIALELIREPDILFVDEPTSGLSSKESMEIMQILKELSLKGKLLFVVIHQPSSDIYKLFHKIIFLDEGGYQIFYGNPIKAIAYFQKHIVKAENEESGICGTCGNLNPENIIGIIETKTFDESDRFTDRRKIIPREWKQIYDEDNKGKIMRTRRYVFEELPLLSTVASKFRQFKTFFLRDFFSKLANRQYLLVIFIEAPVLAFVLSFILKYIDNLKSDVYVFRENQNIMPYIFMCTIISSFIGLMVSAEEIFKDRNILKRESILNLSRNSYIFAKLGLLFFLSAIQSLLFVIIGNSVLEIKGMLFEYWLVLFSIAALSNTLGLIVSSSFDSVVTIYIVIPFLIIPQMLLAGAMFNYDKLNRSIGGGGEKVPLIAEFMPSRWAFEALAVDQFMNNKYEKIFYPLEKKESYFNYRNVYYAPELKSIVENYKKKKYVDKLPCPISEDELMLLYNEISRENKINRSIKFNRLNEINIRSFNDNVADSLLYYINSIQDFYRIRFNYINETRDSLINTFLDTPAKSAAFQKLKNSYYNEYLAHFVKNTFTTNPITAINNRLVQKIDPVYLDPADKNMLNYRTHFLAPRKSFMGYYFPTLTINIITLWLYNFILYVILYFNVFKRINLLFEKYKLKLKNYFGTIFLKIRYHTLLENKQKESLKKINKIKKRTEKPY